jgi:hypothetical protein
VVTAIVQLVLGAAALLFGRRLIWLFVGVVGFLIGLELGPQLFGGQSELVIIVLSIVLGIAGAVLALIIPRAGFAVFGFLAGGSILMSIGSQFGINLGDAQWILFIIGGIIGLILSLAVFDIALVVLSSLVGANMIVSGLRYFITLDGALTGILMLALVVVGIVVQMGLARRTAQTV